MCTDLTTGSKLYDGEDVGAPFRASMELHKNDNPTKCPAETCDSGSVVMPSLAAVVAAALVAFAQVA